MTLTENEIIELLPPGEWEIESTIDFARAIESAVADRWAVRCEAMLTIGWHEDVERGFNAALRRVAAIMRCKE